jgi:hypothetical protein
MDVFHMNVIVGIWFRRDILDNMESIFLLNHIDIVLKSLVDTEKNIEILFRNIFFILLNHNHQYDIDANNDEDHNQVFDHKYRHMLEHLLNMEDSHILQ